MKRLVVLTVVLLAIWLGLQLPTQADPVTEPIKLFNGKNLTNFYTYLAKYGKNNDPEKVFTVDNGMIRVSGKVFGCFTTEKEFENYHLVTEFKWGE
jgi:hypothetical protein